MIGDEYRKMLCRYCEVNLPKPFLDLGAMALANSFVPLEKTGEEEFTCSLSLTRCPGCGLVQLTHVVPPEIMFTNYLYVSSTTKTFHEHFAIYARSVKSRLAKNTGALAVDIGSNDGLLLSCFEKEGMRAVGVEPAVNLSLEANRIGRTTLSGFFGDKIVAEILNRFGRADVITANNVFAHIDDSHSVCRNAFNLLADNGMFVIEFPYLVTMFDNMLFDMIYHEHLSYIALSPLKCLFNGHHLEIFAVEHVASHGGSLRVFVQKQGGGHPLSPAVANLIADEERRGFNTRAIYDAFAKRVGEVRDHLVQFVRNAKNRGETVCGYGAPAKGNTLVNFCKLGPDDIAYIVEDNPLKLNTLAPGSKIPVVPGSHLDSHTPDMVIIFAWNFAPEILEKLARFRQKNVKFVVPLPYPKLV